MLPSAADVVRRGQVQAVRVRGLLHAVGLRLTRKLCGEFCSAAPDFLLRQQRHDLVLHRAEGFTPAACFATVWMMW